MVTAATHLAYLDGARRSREPGEARLERRHLREGAAAADVDSCHPELVGGSRLKLHPPHLAVVWRRPGVILQVHNTRQHDDDAISHLSRSVPPPRRCRRERSNESQRRW